MPGIDDLTASCPNSIVSDPFLLQLTREALADLEAQDRALAAPMRKAIRLARLRNDWEAVYWLSMELDRLGNDRSRTQRIAEVAPFFTREELRRVHERSLEESLAARAIPTVNEYGELDEERVTSLSVPELDEAILSFAAVRRDPIPQNLHPYDAAAFSEQRRHADASNAQSADQLRRVRARLAQRTHTYLSRVEGQLARGQQQADFFEHNRRYVDRRLTEVSSDASEQLRAAYERAGNPNPEARSHALTSCRRALKSLADRLYPASSTPVRGADGKERTLDDAKFVARIWQYISNSSAGSASRRLLQAEVERLGQTVDTLNELASKGVHADVTPAEVSACVFGMYGLTGALLHLYDEESGASLSLEQLPGSQGVG